MRRPTSEEKIQAQSIEEIRDALDRERRRLARLKDKPKLGRRVVSGGALLNAVVLHFLELPPADREAIARKGLASYWTRLMSDDATEIDLGTAGEATKAKSRNAKKEPISPPGTSREGLLRDRQPEGHGKKPKGSNVP